MPVKNAGPYLKACIGSILAQTYTDWELIAVNDGSTDNSKALLVQYAHEHENIHTYDSSGTGIVSALQTAYGYSNGNIIHRMDADDLMPLTKLASMNNALHKGAVVTGKVSYFCDEREMGNGFEKYTKWLNGLMSEGDFWRDIYRECSIPSSAWVMYRADFNLIGGFDSALMPEDYDLSFRMYEHQLKIIRLQEVVHHWRDSETRTSRNEVQYFPIAYIPLKVHFFLKIDYNPKKPLVLWGAGKKGKLVAKELLERGISFTWRTNNEKKVGKDIYGLTLKSEEHMDYKTTQTILALSSPTDQKELKIELDTLKLKNNEDFFWFF